MGVYLSKPKTNKKSECGGDFSEIAFGLTSMQGWRKNMEDAHLIQANLDEKNVALFGVFDGHGGPAVARWVGKNMLREFQRNLAACELAAAKWDMTESVPCDLETALIKGKAKPNPLTGTDSDNSSDHEFGQDDVDGDADEEQEVKISASEVPKRVALVCEALQRTYMSMDERLRTDGVRQNLKVLHEQAFTEDIADAAPPVEDDNTEWQRMLEMYLTGTGQKLLYFRDEDNEEQSDEDEEGRGGQQESPFTKYESIGPVVEDITDEIATDGDDADTPITVSNAPTTAASKDSPTNVDCAMKTEPNNSKDSSTSESAKQSGAVKNKKDTATTDTATTDTATTDTATTDTATTDTATTDTVTTKTATTDTATTKTATANTATSTTKMDETDTTNEDVPMIHQSAPAVASSAPDLQEEDELDDDDTAPFKFDKGDIPDARQMLPYRPEQCGSTATSLAIVRSDDDVDILVTANAGDSRIVLCRGTEAISLTRDHKPQSREELRRIENAGGKITMGRVDGNLNLSRCVGDLAYKADAHIPQEAQRITAFPDIRVCELSPEDKFVIIACDGIWDCMTNQELVDYIITRIREQGSDSENGRGLSASILSTICEEVCDRCLAGNPLTSEGIGCDNMTLMIVTLGECLRSGTSSAKPRLYSGRHYRLLKNPQAGSKTATTATVPNAPECIV